MEEKGQGDKWAEEWQRHTPFGAIVVTIITVIGWLVFILLYALYWSNGFSTFQNIIVTLVSLVIMGLLIGLEWMVWGWRHARYWTRWGGDWNKPK